MAIALLFCANPSRRLTTLAALGSLICLQEKLPGIR
jgi:hypothetical protein